MSMLWHSEEVERILSAGYRYREQLRREALARAGRPAPRMGSARLAETSRLGEEDKAPGSEKSAGAD